MYDSFAASCDQPIHLINIISISHLAINLLKKMSLHLYICTQCCQAWHIHLQFNNIVILRYAVGPAIDVVRRNYGVNHPHESGRSLDYSSDSSFSDCLVGRNFSLLFVESIAASAPGVLPRRCKGMQEYVRKPPPFPLARDTAGARECGAT